MSSRSETLCIVEMHGAPEPWIVVRFASGGGGGQVIASFRTKLEARVHVLNTADDYGSVAAEQEPDSWCIYTYPPPDLIHDPDPS